MAASLETTFPEKRAVNEKLAQRPSSGGIIVFGLILAAGLFYISVHLSSDLAVEKATTLRPFLMLAGALLIAVVTMNPRLS